MKNSLKYIVSAALSLSLMCFIAACGKDDAAWPTSGRLRFFNAVADAPTAGCDLSIDGVSTNLRTFLTPGTPLVDSTFKFSAGFPGVTDSSYLYLLEGPHAIKVNTPVGTATTTLSQNVDVAAGKTYTAFLADSVSKMSLVVIQDVLPLAITGQVSVRVMHLSANAPNVDVFVSGQSAFANVPYKTATTFAQVRVDTGTVKGTINYEIRAAGAATSTLKGSLTGLVAGRVYTIVARGLVGKTPALGVSTIIHGR